MPYDLPVAITMGCPAGVGPEIIVSAFSRNGNWSSSGKCVVFGSSRRLYEAASLLGVKARCIPWNPGSVIEYTPERNVVAIPVFELSFENESFQWGVPSPDTGRASMEYIVRAIDCALDGSVHGIVTAPISKYGLRMAGINFPGHTEILADRTGTSNYAMMLAGSRLRVVLCTIHVPLKEVSPLLSSEVVFNTIRLTDSFLSGRLGISKPSIMVAGLNPHAGEEGMFGSEEGDVIAPAIERARKLGMNVSGPYPPDTVFYNAVNSDVEAVVCMYHDQGLIPFKLVHFKDGVNITIGLPIIRTSVDHGTAYDIAGKGIADSSSLEEAVRMALSMSRCGNRRI
jgi:4-hydroxythreonine-4-phosphate dehydrogenase